jgi:hypothetical protein
MISMCVISVCVCVYVYVYVCVCVCVCWLGHFRKVMCGALLHADAPWCTPDRALVGVSSGYEY